MDLGLKVQATPRLHPNDEVTLDLQFDISSLSGQNVNGIPILSNRSLKQTVRLKEDQTSFLAGIIESNETNTITGLPGLAQAGPLGYLAGVRGNQNSKTELVIAITPRQLRATPRNDSSLYAGRGAGSESGAPAASAVPRRSHRRRLRSPGRSGHCAFHYSASGVAAGGASGRPTARDTTLRRSSSKWRNKPTEDEAPTGKAKITIF